jgi:hypothetical protein
MDIKELYEKCKEQVDLGNGDKLVYFDTEAVCFDQHIVKVHDAFYEDDMCGHDMLLLGYEFKDVLFHYNKD